MKIKFLKKAGIGFAIFIGVIVLVFTGIYVAPLSKTSEFIADEYKFDLDYYKELEGVPVISQETGYTCFIVSMAIVKNYFGVETTEHSLRSALDLLKRSKGILPNEYLAYANQVFDPLSISASLVNPTSQAEILNIITESLENNMPVVIFYSAKDDWNKPHYNTHYAVVYEIDMKNEIIKISNPYGYSEKLSFSELYDGLDFTNYEAEPFSFRLARKAGIVKNNTLFVFENIY